MKSRLTELREENSALRAQAASLEVARLAGGDQAKYNGKAMTSIARAMMMMTTIVTTTTTMMRLMSTMMIIVAGFSLRYVAAPAVCQTEMALLLPKQTSPQTRAAPFDGLVADQIPSAITFFSAGGRPLAVAVMVSVAVMVMMMMTTTTTTTTMVVVVVMVVMVMMVVMMIATMTTRLMSTMVMVVLVVVVMVVMMMLIFFL